MRGVMFKDTLRFKISLLSISLLTIMSGAAVAPGMSEFAKVFSSYSPTTVKLIVSLPPLLIIPFSLLSGFLSSCIAKKKLLITGLIIYIIGGVGASFVDSMLPLLLFRAVLGIGTGIILPLSTGLISDFYDGNERTRLLGFSSASNCLGAILANIAAGILVSINWHYAFFVYFLAVPVLLMVISFIQDKPSHKEAVDSKIVISKQLFPWAIAAFLVMLAFFGVVTNLSLLIYNRNLGDSHTAGFIFAVNALCMMASGAFFLAVRKKLKDLFPWFMLFMMASGYAGLAFAGSLPVVIISIILSGLGTGLAFPFIMNKASEFALEDNSIAVMGIVSSSAFLGQFSSPLILDNIPDFTGDPVSSIFGSMALIAGSISLVSFIRGISKR